MDGQHGAGAPEQWEADVVLADGGTARIRPIRPSDAGALSAMHRSQSDESRYFRFFAPMPELSPRDLERFTRVDHADRVALVTLLGDAIIAVARFDRVEPTVAELALMVADAHQGRGLGAILLEHLASIARERGITCFVAEVLPANTRMLALLERSGYRVRQRLDDGVVLIEADLAETAASARARQRRADRASRQAIGRLLEPGSVLIAGVSSTRDSPGGRFLRALDCSPFTGAIHVVTRDAFEVAGHEAHASIRDVPGPVDLAVLAVKPEDCLAAIDECALIGVRTVIVPTEGFADAGDAGLRLQRRLVARARHHGIRVLGPAAFGVLRTGEGAMNLSLAPYLPRGGETALAAQSSALAAMVLAGADDRGIGIAEFVAAGSRADLSILDCLARWEDDGRSGPIGLVLESVAQPRALLARIRRIARERPVVVLSGCGERSATPPGHDVPTSDLPSAVLPQLLDAAGAVRVGSTEQLLDAIDLLDREGVPAGSRIGVIANSPALGTALCDAVAATGLPVAGESSSVPLTDDRRMVVRAVTRMAAPGGVDVIVIGILDPLTPDLAALAREIGEVARGSGVSAVLCVVSHASRFDELHREARADRHLPPVHATPERAVQAIAGAVAAARRSSQQGSGAERPLEVSAGVDLAAASLCTAELLDRRGILDLDPSQSARLLAHVGITVTETEHAEPALALGMRTDPLHGRIVSLSAAERSAKSLGDIAYALAPTAPADAEHMLAVARSVDALLASRTERGAVRDLLVRIGLLIDALPQIASLDLAIPAPVAPQGGTMLQVTSARLTLAVPIDVEAGLRRHLRRPGIDR